MMLSRKFSGLLFAGTLAWFAAGCGGTDAPKLHKVSGLVTFDGHPVEEGTVMFLHDATQDSRQAPLGAEGRYEVEVREGQHKIAVEPVIIETPPSATSPGSSDYKKAPNIPGRYRSPETSGFTADVTAPAEFSFQMQPGKGK